MVPSVSGEQEDQNDWVGESPGRDAAVNKAQTGGSAGRQESWVSFWV